jgi:hypothetical protein
MPLVAVLWLALLHALSLAAPPRPARAGTASTPVRVEQAARPEHRAAMPRPEAPVEALPAGTSVTPTVLARASSPAPVGGGAPSPALPSVAGRGLAALAARQALRRYGAAPHVVTARGGLLPYFPTAPPIQG